MLDRLKKWFANELLRYAWLVASNSEKAEWIERFQVIDTMAIWADYDTADC